MLISSPNNLICKDRLIIMQVVVLVFSNKYSSSSLYNNLIRFINNSSNSNNSNNNSNVLTHPHIPTHDITIIAQMMAMGSQESHTPFLQTMHRSWGDKEVPRECMYL